MIKKTEHKWNASLYEDIKNMMQYLLDNECADFMEHIEADHNISTKDLDKLAMQNRDHIYGCAVRCLYYLKERKNNIKVPTIRQLRDMDDE